MFQQLILCLCILILSRSQYTVSINEPAVDDSGATLLFYSLYPSYNSSRKISLPFPFSLLSNSFRYFYFYTNSTILFTQDECRGDSSCPQFRIEISPGNFRQKAITVWRNTWYYGLDYKASTLDDASILSWRLVFSKREPSSFYLRVLDNNLTNQTHGINICNHQSCQTIQTNPIPGTSLKIRSCGANCTNCLALDNKCQTCDTGYSLNSQMNSCDAVCPNDCFSCYSPNLCAACKVGFYLISENSTCATCQSGCMNCDMSSKCIACYAGFYLDSQRYSCKVCMENCQFCTSATECSACVSGTTFDKNSNKCVPASMSVVGVIVIVLASATAAVLVFIMVKLVVARLRSAKRSARVRAIRSKEIYKPQMFLLNPSIKTTQQCVICLEVGIDTMTTCGHFFHGGCLFSWHAKKNECPICRNPDIAAQVQCADCHVMYYYAIPCPEACTIPVEQRHQECWAKAVKANYVACTMCSAQPMKSEEMRLPTTVCMKQP